MQIIISNFAVMLFAGLSSAYIVSMGDAFWLQTALPNAFWWSTACIAVSSVTFIFSISAARKGQASLLKVGMMITLLLGLLFIYFQWKGFEQLWQILISI